MSNKDATGFPSIAIFFGDRIVYRKSKDANKERERTLGDTNSRRMLLCQRPQGHNNEHGQNPEIYIEIRLPTTPFSVVLTVLSETLTQYI